MDRPVEPKRRLRRLRQWWCPHTNTEEEWSEIDRVPGFVLDTVTRLRTYWRCNTCGKEVRRSRVHINPEEPSKSDDN